MDEVHDGVATQGPAGCRWERTVRQWGLTPSSAYRVGGLTLWQRLGVTNDPKTQGWKSQVTLRSSLGLGVSPDIQEVRALQAH